MDLNSLRKRVLRFTKCHVLFVGVNGGVPLLHVVFRFIQGAMNAELLACA